MRKALLLITLLGCSTTLFAQRNILPRFLRRMIFEKDTSKRGSFFLLPVLSSAPETGLEVGASGLYSFYTDTLTKGTRVSNLFGYATITTKGQERLSLSTSYWTPQNQWHYIAAASYVNFPANFYGIGNNTLKSYKVDLGLQRFKLNLEADKRLGKYIYLGAVAGGFNYRFENKNPGGVFDTDTRVEYRNGGSTVFIGPSLIFDSRNNNTYTTKGIVVTSYFNAMQGLFGNNSYSGGFFNIEYAQFFSLNRKFVLGLNVQDQNLTGGSSPFYLLPALGSDEMMRGYYNGRYRDRNLVAGQAELRYRLSDRIGLVGFAGTGTVFNTSFNAKDLKPNYGGGLRYFFDVEKGLSIRVDYGFGEKRPGESRQSGLYLALGEAF
ncbi:BamA/TamA family outer membrane protein [Mucilaginibacter ginkgonis]|uniref:Polymerase n=1 Tax=Mucilaginibacter ginkgonis TaxID=2682091 RepID=A0A6I4I0U5_9SPHI|nr:polymerase [Mucilaginibacter ginkgonis]QQL48734.1 polymerase [Mucilaginibacter ginkgonis]